MSEPSVESAPQIGYWMNETSGVLKPAIVAYLNHDEMTKEQIAAMRAYLRQWIAGDWMPGPMLDSLRTQVDRLTSQSAIASWVGVAAGMEIDPL